MRSQTPSYSNDASHPPVEEYEEVVVDEHGNEDVRYVTLVGGKEDPYHSKT